MNKKSEEKPGTGGKGIVYLVGAGPGDAGLITVRGMELTRQAEVIIYDYLIPPRLVKSAQPGAELIYVGKKAGQHTLPQEQINQLLIEKAQAGRCVVRLKGGDPFIFGRGGEEAIALAEAGVDFEVVPGVTAGAAAAAYAGIPITHRDLASDVAFITGHEDATRTGDSQVDWQSLGKWKGTLVFYMGVKNLPVICQKLQEYGMPKVTPAAVICWGTTARQQTVVADLDNLPAAAERQGITPPSVIIVGKVVTLREQLAWFEKRPLFGRRIIVTRARSQASELVEKLEELGAAVWELATIRIEEVQDAGPMREAIAKLHEYQWVIFTSVNGVEAFFAYLNEANQDARALAKSRICAIGPATAKKLQIYGIKADMVPEEYVAEGILDKLTETGDLKGKRILLPRAQDVREDLPEGLRKLGAMVDEVAAYRTVADEEQSEEIRRLIAEDQADWITFTSSSTVRNFLEKVDLKQLAGRKVRVASIGPITSATIKEKGLKVDAQAKVYTIEGLVEAIVRAENDKK